MSFTAKDAKALRDATGAGMMDAKKASTPRRRKRPSRRFARRVLPCWRSRRPRQRRRHRCDRRRRQHRCRCPDQDRNGLAKNDAVTSLAQTLADAVLAGGPGAVDAHTTRSTISRSPSKNIELGAVEQVSAADGNTLDTYLHSQDGRGVNAVIVEGSGVSQDDLHQVALHIAFAKWST